MNGEQSCTSFFETASTSMAVWVLIISFAVYWMKSRRDSPARAETRTHLAKERRFATLQRGEAARQTYAHTSFQLSWLEKPAEAFNDWVYGDHEFACIFRPCVFDPLDSTQRGVVFAISVCFVFAVSAFWSNTLESKIENQVASYVVNVLLTTVVTALWSLGNRKLINFFAPTDRVPLLHSRLGRMVPSIALLVVALVLDVLVFVFVFADASVVSCAELVQRHVVPFAINLFSHYVFPGLPLAFVKWWLLMMLGKPASTAELEEKLAILFNRLEEIEREQSQGATGGESQPLLK